MGGGLMQLVAYGAQDIYLTGNPQITFFKVVYRRHTNFSMESIQQTWNGSDGTSSDGRCTATVSRNGDLIHKMYLQIASTGVTNEHNPGMWGITDVTLEIGGQQIDKHYGHYMEAWAELTEVNPYFVCAGVDPEAAADARGAATAFQMLTAAGGYAKAAAPPTTVFVPLYFWFCKNPGLALPLIALQYHEVKVILNHVYSTAFGTVSSQNLWVDYVYLDTDERRRFAQQSHEYLIEQVQHLSTSAAKSMDLNFNHPVKELIWTGAHTTTAGSQVRAAVTDANWKIKLNGHDRMAERPRYYFTRQQVRDYHSGPGGVGGATASLPQTAVKTNKSDDSIAVYSFALKPEEHQPSGTCNFSRIDNAQLVQDGTAVAHEVYAVNYNVLRIMSGMGGLAYSN
jgi:hypothetical protein